MSPAAVGAPVVAISTARAAGGFSESQPLTVHGRDAGAAREHKAERLGQTRHRAGGAHHHARPVRRHQPSARAIEPGVIDLAGAAGRPEPPAVRARAQPLAFVVAGEHRPDRRHDRRHIRADSAHDLRGNRLVAAADEHHRVERQRAQHFLCVHGEQVPQDEARWIREGLVQRDRRKREGQPARHRHTPLNRGDELRSGGVTGVEVARRGGNADDRAIERLAREPGRFEEGLAQEPRECFVAIAGQSPKDRGAFDDGASIADIIFFSCAGPHPRYLSRSGRSLRSRLAVWQ